MTNERWKEWRKILSVNQKDSTIDLEQLKKELSDYDNMIDRMSFLTALATGGLLSYPTYTKQSLEEAVTDYLGRVYEGAYNDGRDDTFTEFGLDEEQEV